MVFWRRSGEGTSLRLGVVTSKKISLRANKRNRARRHLREAYRQIRPYLSGDYDVLLIGRRTILQAKWPDILCEMLALAKRAGMIDVGGIELAKKDLNLNR
jgi:ribonuclease P protein component